MPDFRTHARLDSVSGMFLAARAVLANRPSIGSDSFSLMQRDLARRHIASGFDDEFARQFDRVFGSEAN